MKKETVVLVKTPEQILAEQNKKKVFDLLLKICKNFPDEDYTKFENECKAIVELESLRFELAKAQTFYTPYKSSPMAFRVKCEFWLRTVFEKLEDDKIDLIIKKIKWIKHQNSESYKVSLMEILISAMNVQPEPKVYAFHIKNEEKKERVRTLNNLEIDF